MPVALEIGTETVHSPGTHDRLLGETAYVLLQDEDVDTLAQAVFEKLRVPLQLDVYFHYLVSPDGTHLQLGSSGGNEAARAVMGSRLEFGQAVCGTVARSCEWMHITDVQSRVDDMTALIRSQGIQCYTCQPLIANGRVLGTFSFGSTHRREFNDEELEIFRLVAHQITLATERRLRNEQLRTLEREATSGRMSATLAHEINNPLDSLTGLLHLLQTEVISGEGKQLLHSAQVEVMRLAETTQRTLDIVRGRSQTPKPFLVHEFLHNMLTTIKLPHNVPVEAALDRELCVKVVQGELRQILFNLLINAAHFSPFGGKVRVQATRSNGSAEISVTDEGPGIPPNIQDHIFQPYFTTRGAGGTGLGLWTSREMAERAGGSLTFKSHPEQKPGTSFTLTLPLFKATSH